MRIQFSRCIAPEHVRRREQYLCETCLALLVLGNNPVLRVINESTFLLWYFGAHIGNLGKIAIAVLLEYLFSKRGIFYPTKHPRRSKYGCECKCRCHSKCMCACKCKSRRGATSGLLLSSPGSKQRPSIENVSRLIPEFQAWLEVGLRALVCALQLVWCEQPRKVAGVKARKIAEGERLRMIKSSG